MVMHRPVSVTRRGLVAALGLGALGPRWLAARTWAASPPVASRAPRVVVLDWGLAAQVLALGVTPAHGALADSLARIAPLFVAPPAHRHEDGYLLAMRRARALGDALGRPAQTSQLLAQTDAQLHAVRDRLAQYGMTNRPIYLMSPVDTRLTHVFGRESVFGGTLAAIGLTNAWKRPSDTEGMAQVDYTQLGADTSASAMLIGTQPELLRMLGQSPLWQAMPFVRSSRVARLPVMLPTGGTPTAVRLALALRGALTGAAA